MDRLKAEHELAALNVVANELSFALSPNEKLKEVEVTPPDCKSFVIWDRPHKRATPTSEVHRKFVAYCEDQKASVTVKSRGGVPSIHGQEPILGSRLDLDGAHLAGWTGSTKGLWSDPNGTRTDHGDRLNTRGGEVVAAHLP